MSITYNYTSADGSVNEQVGQVIATTYLFDCTNDENANGYLGTTSSVTGRARARTPTAPTCPPYWPAQPPRPTSTRSMDRRRITQAVQQAVEPKIASELAALQQGIYSDILAGGSSLTTGTSDATNIQAAAQRLQGAGALLDGYVAQGLPQALGSDDNVRSLVSGINNDAFASTDPQINIWGVQPAAAVPEQIVNFYKTAKAVMPGFDPAELLTDDIYRRAYPVSAAILGHIVPPTTAQASA